MKRVELLNILEVVGNALADDTVSRDIPIQGHFCFDEGSVYAYDGNKAVVARCTIDGTFAIHGSTLLGLLRSLTSEELELEVGEEYILVTSSGTVLKLPYLSKDKFCFERPAEGKHVVVINEDFINGLQACLKTCSRDLTQRLHYGIGLFIRKIEEAKLVSTDGDTVTRYIVDNCTVFTPESTSVLLPRGFVEILLKATKGTSYKGTLNFNEDWVWTSGDLAHVYGNLLGEPPSDYEADFKKALEFNPQFIKVPDGFKEALQRAQVIGGKNTVPTFIHVCQDTENKVYLKTESHLGIVRDEFIVNVAVSESAANVSAELVYRSVVICDEMAVLENCCMFRQGDKVLIIQANM